MSGRHDPGGLTPGGLTDEEAGAVDAWARANVPALTPSDEAGEPERAAAPSEEEHEQAAVDAFLRQHFPRGAP